MRVDPHLGAAVARSSIGLGVIGLAAATVAVVELSAIAALSVFTLILFQLLVGWRTYRLRTRGYVPPSPESGWPSTDTTAEV